MPRERGRDRRHWLQILQGVVLAVAALYFGKQVLMPLTMAVLLTFLLTPVVNWNRSVAEPACWPGIS